MAKKLYSRPSKTDNETGSFCWSFCDSSCILRQNNLCQRKRPMFRQSGPNEGCYRIRDLVFGSSDYEAEKTAYYRACNEHYNKTGSSDHSHIPNWRAAIRDCQWPGMPIYANPDKWFQPNSYLIQTKDKVLWEPMMMEDMLFEEAGVVDALLNAAQHDYHTGSLGNHLPTISRAITAFFLTTYKRKLFSVRPELEALFTIAKSIFLNYGAPLVAAWCLESFCIDEMEWAKAISSVSKISQNQDHVANLKIQIEKLEKDKTFKYVSRAQRLQEIEEKKHGREPSRESSTTAGPDSTAGSSSSSAASKTQFSTGFCYAKRKARTPDSDG